MLFKKLFFFFFVYFSLILSTQEFLCSYFHAKRHKYEENKQKKIIPYFEAVLC